MSGVCPVVFLSLTLHLQGDSTIFKHTSSPGAMCLLTHQKNHCTIGCCFECTISILCKVLVFMISLAKPRTDA
jgi:hypothetical protein